MFQKKRIRRNKPRRPKKGLRVQFNGMWPLLKGLVSIAGIIFMSLLFILGYDVVTQARFFNAKQIVVTGNKQLSEKAVLQCAQVSKGMNIFSLNLHVARKRLLSNGWVADARVGRELPDQIMVHITEHVPMAIIELADKRYFMDTRGRLFKEWHTDDGGHFPCVTGLDYADIAVPPETSGRAMGELLALAKVLRRVDSPVSFETLSRIHVDRELGFTLFGEGEVRAVRLGFGHYDKKQLRLARVMRYLEGQQGIAAFNNVDLSNEKYVIVAPVWGENMPDKTIRRS